MCSTSKKKLGCNAQLIVDEFGEKLLEELDYLQEARNIQVMHHDCTSICVGNPSGAWFILASVLLLVASGVTDIAVMEQCMICCCHTHAAGALDISTV